MPPVYYHDGQFPPKDMDWSQLIPFLSPAGAALSRFDAVLELIPNPQVLLSPLTTQEAVLSSKIEGTQATMTEVLEYEAGAKRDEPVEPEKIKDIQEVLNYRHALRLAEEQLKTIPLSGRLLSESHKILLDGVRGRNKSPGQFRKIPNWIGPPGCNEQDARYVPISADQLPEGVSQWEKYIHSDQMDALVQLAVIHAEFEALHPYLDGNGRLGRMLIPLYLYSKGLLRAPTFYISAYLESHREEYYDRLMAVSEHGDWTGWCVFFLKALMAQAEANTSKARQIFVLYETKKKEFVEITRSKHAITALDFIFKRPLFLASEFTLGSDITESAAKRILRRLLDAGILNQIYKGAGQRSSLLAFSELLDIADHE